MKQDRQHCMQQGHSRIKLGLCVAVSMAIMLLPEIASAACNATGLFTMGGTNKRCDPSQVGIFSAVLCFFESALESMLGNMYCAFQTNMRGPIASVFSLSIAIFGLSVLAGYIRMSFREASKMVLKLALVMAFALNSDYAIKMAGTLFMAMLQSGTAFVLNPLGGANSLTEPDSLITGLFNFMTNPSLADLGNTNNCGGLPCLNDGVLKIMSKCAAYLGILGLVLMIFMPVVIAFIFMLLVQYLGLYVKSLLSYLASIVIITFLLILTPLFISFALFSVTYALFDRWRSYMQTFSIQAVILFAFLAMLGVVTQGFTGFLYGLMRLLRPYDMTINLMLWTFPITACGVCEFKIEQLTTGSQTVRCQPAVAMPVPVTQTVVRPSEFPPRASGIGVTAGTNTSAVMPNGVSPNTPIRYDLTEGAVISSVINDMPNESSQHNGSNYVIPILSLIERADFMLYIAMNVIAFGIVASLFQEFIGRSSDLAKRLGGASGVGGFGGHSDFEGGSIGLAGMKSVEAGIKGMEREMLRNPFNNVDGNIFNRFRDGFFGRSTVNRRDFQTNEGYLAAKKGEIVTGGFLGALMRGAADDQAEKEKEYEVKLAQRRVDDAALKLKETRETAEKHARELSDSLDALDAMRKDPNADKLMLREALKRTLDAKKAYDKSYQEALSRQDKLQTIKQELRDAEYDMRKAMQGGLIPAGGRVIEPKVGAAALLASSQTLKRAQRKQEEEDKYASKPGYKKQYADPNSAAAASAGRPSGAASSGRNNSSDELISAQEEANQKLAELQKQMTSYGRFMDATKRAEHQKAIDTAKAALGGARTERDAFEIMKGVQGVEAAMERFSDRGLIHGAAVAGVAALAAYAAKASGIVPSMYLQDIQKFLGGAEQQIKKGEVTPDQVEKLDTVPKDLAQAVVQGVTDQADIAARIVPEDPTSPTQQKIDAARAAMQQAVSPADYLKIVGSFDGAPREQLTEVLEKLGFQRDKAVATILSAVSKPKGWDEAAEDKKRAYVSDILGRMKKEMESTAGLRSEAENEEARKTMEDIRARLAATATQEELDQLLHRTVTLRQSASASLSPASFSSIFTVFDQRLGQAQNASAAARTGNDYNAAMISLMGAPRDMDQAVIGALQNHVTSYDKLIPPDVKKKMEMAIVQAQLESKSATSGKQHDDIITRLGTVFVDGESAPTIAMTQWDNTQDEKKRESAEAILARTKKDFEAIADKLSEKDRLEYEEEIAKATAALSSAAGTADMRAAVAQSLAIAGVLKQSAARIQTQEQRQQSVRSQRQVANMLERHELTPGGMSIGEMNLAGHVMGNLREWDRLKDTHKQEYSFKMLDRIESTYKQAGSRLSEQEREKYEAEISKLRQELKAASKEYKKYESALDKLKEQFGGDTDNPQFIRQRDELRRTSDYEAMRGVIAKAAAMEGALLDKAADAKAEWVAAQQARPASSGAREDEAADPSPATIGSLMPTLSTSVLTGQPNIGFAMYFQQTLKGFDVISSARKREYFNEFIEKSKRDIDQMQYLKAEEKAEHKKKLDLAAQSLASEASEKEMREALSLALAAMGKINAGSSKPPISPQFVSMPAVGTVMPNMPENLSHPLAGLMRPPAAAQKPQPSAPAANTAQEASALTPSLQPPPSPPKVETPEKLLAALKIDVNVAMHVMGKADNDRYKEELKKLEEKLSAAKTDEERMAVHKDLSEFAKQHSDALRAALQASGGAPQPTPQTRPAGVPASEIPSEGATGDPYNPMLPPQAGSVPQRSASTSGIPSGHDYGGSSSGAQTSGGYGGTGSETPMFESVQRIEVGGRVYEISQEYDKLEDDQKQEVQRILAYNPEMNLQQAIEKMRKEEALRLGYKRDREEDEDDDEEDKSGSKKSSSTRPVNMNTPRPTRPPEKPEVQGRKKKTLTTITLADEARIQKLMKQSGMTREKAIEILNIRGRT